MAKEMKITYTSWGREEGVVNRFNKWIQNGHDINKAFIKIVHNGSFYTMFYDARLDKPSEYELLYDPETTSVTCNN
jgi:hypothetical protein